MSPLQIFVLTQGFILIGRGEFNGREWEITECQQVTRWEATCGIGGVALQGQEASKATLHPQGDTYVPLGALVQRINCNESAWA